MVAVGSSLDSGDEHRHGMQPSKMYQETIFHYLVLHTVYFMAMLEVYLSYEYKHQAITFSVLTAFRPDTETTMKLAVCPE